MLPVKFPPIKMDFSEVKPRINVQGDPAQILQGMHFLHAYHARVSFEDVLRNGVMNYDFAE